MARSLQITVATSLLLMLVLLGFVPQVQAYTFLTHSICKGWTEERTPVTARICLPGDTVYLYFEIIWVDLSEFEAKWRELHEMERGIVAASRIVEHGAMKSFSIQLLNPSGEVVNSFFDRKMERPLFKPSGAVSCAFLETLNVTETTKNGIWHVNWYDSDKLLFSGEFAAGSASPSPSPSPTPSPIPVERAFGEQYGLWIVAVVAVGIVAVFVIMASKRRKRPPYAPAPPSKATLELKYCTECGSQIPASDAFCNRCGAKQ